MKKNCNGGDPIFILEATKSDIRCACREKIASGSVNAHSVEFQFNEDWDDLTKVAVFKIRDHVVKVLIDQETNQCTIPWDVFKKKYVGNALYAGVYGTGDDGNLIIPTIYISLGVLEEGADESCSQDEAIRTPGLLDQILAELGRKIDDRNEISNEDILNMWMEGIEYE